MTEVTASDILSRCAELLQEKGWHQGALTGPQGQMCALGAMHVANSELFGEHTMCCELDQGAAVVYNAAYGRLIRTISPNTWQNVSIPQWNDADERTAEDVILAFKHAATMDD